MMRFFARRLDDQAGSERLAAVAVLLWVAFAALLIWPSLSGDFLMDDYPNLHGLVAVGLHPDLGHIMKFTLSGFSGPTGRPVSLFTFALQAAEGSARPFDFKYVNMVVHLLNGCMLLLLWLRLAPRMIADRRAQLGLSLTVFALWLVHPLQITAIAYVVQRMTSLSATFTLLALLGYVTGRDIAMRGRELLGSTIAALSIGIGGLLAVFAKETGVLTLIYALVIEFTLFGDTLEHARAWVWFRRACLYAPLLAFMCIVAIRFDSLILAGYKTRTFGIGGRVLTEPRVIWDYLGNIVSPAPRSLGLFHDDMRASAGLLTPWTTLPALLGIIGLIALAAASRRRAPVLAFGLGWFLGGQLLESSIFPLELYYEHRNYLPLAGVLTLFAFYLPAVLARVRAILVRRALAIAAIVMLAELIGTSYVSYLYWGRPLAQAEIWANDHPDSVRAQIRLSSVQLLLGHPRESEATLRRLSTRRPRDVGAALSLILETCNIPDRDIRWAVNDTLRASHAEFNLVPLVALMQMVTMKENGACKEAPALLLTRIINQLLANPAYRSQFGNLHLLRGRLAFLSGDYLHGLADFDTTYRASQNPALLARASQHLLANGQVDMASIYYLHATSAFKSHPIEALTYGEDLRELRSRLATARLYGNLSSALRSSPVAGSTEAITRSD